MGLLKTLVIGRPNGLRRRVLGMVGLGGADGERTPAESGSGGSSGGAPTPTFEPAEKALRLKKEPPKDITPPEGFEVVLHKDSLEPGRIIEIIIAGTAVAVANVDGTYFAVANACPHADGPLGEGSMDGAVVTCPYHGWQYDVRTGECKTNPFTKVGTFPVVVVRDAVCVKL